MNARRLGILAPLAALSLSACGLNSVPTAEEQVNAAWGNLQSEYQRRADLIPNLVSTVQGYAKQERDVLIEVTEARASAGRVQLSAASGARIPRRRAFMLTPLFAGRWPKHDGVTSDVGRGCAAFNHSRF